MNVCLKLGDSLTVLPTLAEASVDAVVTDPPYELGFMGKSWDATGIAYNVDLWRQVLRVLKPGGHLLAFSGSRTYHRMTCAIEDAGFEIRDQIMWVYGSGFPKSKNLDGAWKGWGTALKPAHEPIVLARKPLIGTVAENVLAHGTGALNVDGTRVGVETRYNGPSGNKAGGNSLKMSTNGMPQGVQGHIVEGRWPANLIHDGSEEVLAKFPNTKGGVAFRSKSGGNTFGGDKAKPPMENLGYNDTGSAARFFYCAKASKADRDEGNKHPTVKPTTLMRYLCKLVTPPGGVVLDPFLGSGSTGKAAVLEGFNFIGIEREAEYHAIATARVGAAQAETGKAPVPIAQGSLFSEP